MRKKRKRKKRIGISLALLLAAFLFLAASLPLAGAPKKKPALDTYALVSGSVFEERGYALPGADVSLVPETGSGNTKPLEAVSDGRGEFVIRVPPGPMQYSVTVQAKGYQSLRKTLSVQDQERVEVTFQLERESK